MSMQRRPVEQFTTVCDLCNEILTQTDMEMRGTLGIEYGSPVSLPRTKRVQWFWPGSRRKRTHSVEFQNQTEMAKVYDFHGECLQRLIEANLCRPDKPDRMPPGDDPRSGHEIRGLLGGEVEPESVYESVKKSRRAD